MLNHVPWGATTGCCLLSLSNLKVTPMSVSDDDVIAGVALVPLRFPFFAHRTLADVMRDERLIEKAKREGWLDPLDERRNRNETRGTSPSSRNRPPID